jgi:hypothetical protein
MRKLRRPKKKLLPFAMIIIIAMWTTRFGSFECFFGLLAPRSIFPDDK